MSQDQASQTSQWKKELEEDPVDFGERKTKKRKLDAQEPARTFTPIQLSSTGGRCSPINSNRVSPVPTSPTQNLTALTSVMEDIKSLKMQLIEAEKRKDEALSNARRYYKFCPGCLANNKITLTHKSGGGKCEFCSRRQV